MSANNWRTCFQCERNNEIARKQKLNDAVEQYGEIPFDEFEEALAQAREDETELGETLREDYELWITDGVFEVRYYASCNVCGFSFEHEYSVEV